MQTRSRSRSSRGGDAPERQVNGAGQAPPRVIAAPWKFPHPASKPHSMGKRHHLHSVQTPPGNAPHQEAPYNDARPF
ncbi:UNVERIFIED_CONTAM: hypothetical protein Sradi_2166700 [Sesamum radiatum]|uniref:Uncharacterized protein n=1 Tax=Sesamum radiatum TaxID=300843 RepID=A0AAW2T0W5_SESRA